MGELWKKFLTKDVTVGVIGLGYVGLPLAIEFVKSGFSVKGIDVDPDKVAMINSGKSYILDISDDDIKKAVEEYRLSAYDQFNILKEVDAVSICVPTPLRKTKDPDISYIVRATREIKKYLTRGQLVILESTTYPGTTDEIILTDLESTGLCAGKDFFLAFSPERIDPGNDTYNTKNTPKIIGGVTKACTLAAKALYSQAISTVITVSSTRAAEMVKLLENTFRAVNIALVNELSLMCDRLDINVWEVIDAAATKPFGFMPFYPGPGLGGHCIPIDPHYLAWKLKTVNYKARFIELADDININMPHYVVSKIGNALNQHEKSIKGSNILILGIAYKKDINDVRESPSLDIIKFLIQKGANLYYHDPYVETLAGFEDVKRRDVDEAGLQNMDCVTIATDHSCYDYDFIVKNSKLIVDTRNATKFVEHNRERIIVI